MRPRKYKSDLPKCFFEKGNNYYYVKNNKWNNLGPELNQKIINEAIFAFGNRSERETHACIAYMIKKIPTHRARALSVGRKWSIDKDFIVNMIVENNYRCMLTGVKFSLANRDGMKIKPFAPSIDRIDNKIGYTKENCRVVLNTVNIARNTMDDDLLFLVARGISTTGSRRKF